jgi:hypothetical protein
MSRGTTIGGNTPSPLPWSSRDRDHRHRARTGPPQTDGKVVQSFDIYFGVIIPNLVENNLTFCFHINLSCLSMYCFNFDFFDLVSPPQPDEGYPVSCRAFNLIEFLDLLVP